MSRIGDVTQAVRDLVAATYARTEVRYEISYDRLDDELGAMLISVTPSEREITRQTRGAANQILTVVVAVQQLIEDATTAEMEPLFDVTEDIVEILQAAPVLSAGGNRYSLVGMVNAPVYGQENLESMRTFTSVLEVRYHANV